MPNTEKFLWEVGCEELPAWACDALERQLSSLVKDALSDAGIAAQSDITVYVGPRRFAVLADVPKQREESESIVSGPPVRIAFVDGDTSKELTKAGEGFARKVGVSKEELVVNDKGVLQVTKVTPAASFAELWPDLADTVLSKIQFAKPMKWGNFSYRFVRPIRWIVTLLANEEIIYDCWGVTSGRTSRTHRFLGDSRTTEIVSAESYVEALKTNFVLVDQIERREIIESQLENAAKEFGGGYSDPGRVLSEVIHLVEWPNVLVGRFAERYLELPERVLVTAMQSHQRYLPVAKSDGSLAPAFLAVMNADINAIENIRPGYERVLEGRLDDAVFSFERDRARGLDDMSTDTSLGAVVFHAKAGSLAERRDRISAVAAQIAKQLTLDEKQVSDAARIAKADQVSTVVQEFAELEGYTGSLYAKSAGYSDEVCAALEWQFAPRGADAPLPPAGVASAIALADKLELLVTMFAIGEQPTGSRDPHGLRRAAIGVMRIVLEHDLALNLDDAIAVAQSAIEKQGYATSSGAAIAVRDFILDRVEKLLSEKGVRVDAVRAARAAQLPQLQHLFDLASAIDQQVNSGGAEFEHVLEAQDRSRKLLDKAGGIPEGAIDPSAFEVESERELHRVLSATAGPLRTAVAERKFNEAVSLASDIGPAVADFFSKEKGVMIMADNNDIRANRLLLLSEVLDTTAPLGDLSQLQI